MFLMHLLLEAWNYTFEVKSVAQRIYSLKPNIKLQRRNVKYYKKITFFPGKKQQKCAQKGTQIKGRFSAWNTMRLLKPASRGAHFYKSILHPSNVKKCCSSPQWSHKGALLLSRICLKFGFKPRWSWRHNKNHFF